jgi:hypothetical protein
MIQMFEATEHTKKQTSLLCYFMTCETLFRTALEALSVIHNKTVKVSEAIENTYAVAGFSFHPYIYEALHPCIYEAFLNALFKALGVI